MYGSTPMRAALESSVRAFRTCTGTQRRILVLISDGCSADGDPSDLARQLRNNLDVSISTVYLTADQQASSRRLYDTAAGLSWDSGQRTLYSMASRIACAAHPVPVLAAMGWTVPSSGECALYATVSSVTALDEFCGMLLSARFGSADVLLDVVGRVRLDAIINDRHVRTRTNPADQKNFKTCYAHAAAAVIHMSLCRIEGREGGCPTVEEIRNRILRPQNFPPGPRGGSVEQVLKAATTWYRPLRFRKVGEDGARQAVLHRRPVLTTFHLSHSGWDTFSRHFQSQHTKTSVLTAAAMQYHRSSQSGGGHAVVMTGCDPSSLTFMNSWGYQWGNQGSFSVESASALELDHVPGPGSVCLYDVYWYEQDLTSREKLAYQVKVGDALRTSANRHPSLLELEARCGRCYMNSSIAEFKGTIRQAVCPRCHQQFEPQPGHLVQALYARAGISGAV